jgi:isopenicillin N synthase-like dioxygenase
VSQGPEPQSTIPLIDLGRHRGSHPDPAVAKPFGQACSDIGFMLIAGHDIDSGLITDMVSTSREFFSLPTETKRTRRYAGDVQAAHPANKFRGYIAGYTTAETAEDDLEAFQVSWHEDEQEMITAGYGPEFAGGYAPNLWPDTPEAFRDVWRRYFAETRALGDYLLELASLALDLPLDWFVSKFRRQNSVLLTNHYPEQQWDPGRSAGQRLHEHTDYGAFTILYQEHSSGGLDVQLKDGTWTRVPYVPGTFVVNLGDLMAKWTNDRWVATLHRVGYPQLGELSKDRISIPYFQHPNLDTLIETIPTCIPDGELSRHRPVLWRDWGIKRVDELSRTS